ncbi:MAG: hypothetical protein HETSPECPRED_000458 [Heterodermia speciosa]|uniref:Uncharacterized protein n=1 Tax=Heterodermia speciosa TaxID=116794 RepID=A0A8H3IB47_9LECA|nr:MAG: hypothetical protein HETSPECPRED_000458 [Heterodermia speciosa]
MALVLQGAGVLQQIQLGVNELAASLFVGKYVGSILTRKQDAKLFQVLEDEFGVKVKGVPAWLEDVQLDRKFCILGEGLRRIEGKSSMQHVRINTLEGLATFLVLCSRYSIPDKAIVKLLEVFLLGGLGAIDRGKLQDEALPYTLKPLVAAFIRSTKDADAASKQNAKAQTWMSELLLKVDLPRYCFSKKNSQHVFTKLSQFIGDLLGGSTVEEEFIKHTKAPQRSNRSHPDDGRRRIHETVSLDVANVALLAAANGADLCVECITDTTQIILPSHIKPTETKFLVRLWLTQPPANVSQILKMSDPVEKATYLSSYDHVENDSRSALTIFGGATELAAAVSSAFGYTAGSLGGSPHQRIGEMWDKALQSGKSFTWAVKPMPNLLYPMRFHFLLPDRRLDPHETMLANAISKMDSRMAPLSREIASIIDELYRWKSYTHTAFESELISAVQVINVGMAVGALHNITQPLAPDDAQYALSLQSIDHNGALSDLCPHALIEGVSHQELIWAASTLWGGASIASQGHASINDSVQGVVAPHCVVLLDVIRNPLLFVRKGMSGKLLTMCRGSVPLLARDPNNGFVLAPDTKYTEPERQDLVVQSVNEADQITEMTTDMIITFEPDVLGPSPFRSHFCCWYMGNLAFEVHPIIVFKNILHRGTESMPHDNPAGLQRSGVASGEVLMKTLGWIELLSLKKYRVEGGVVVLNAHDKAGWLVSMAGLAGPGKVVFQRLQSVDLSLCQIESEDTVLLSTLH